MGQAKGMLLVSLNKNRDYNFLYIKPWLLFSAIPFGLSYMALWQAWPDESSNEKFAYSIMTVLIYNLAGIINLKIISKFY